MGILEYLAFQTSSAALLRALKWGATVKLAYKVHFQKQPSTQTWVLNLYFIMY